MPPWDCSTEALAGSGVSLRSGTRPFLCVTDQGLICWEWSNGGRVRKQNHPGSVGGSCFYTKAACWGWQWRKGIHLRRLSAHD